MGAKKKTAETVAVMILSLGLGCGRTAGDFETCLGDACPCVFDDHCPESWVCFDGVCVGEEDLARCLAEGPQPESCNGRDDDCNGRIDEDFLDRACTAEGGGRVCAGVERCAGAEGWVCDALIPRDELCDGLDDD